MRRTRKIATLIPNGLSMLNLIFGFLSIVSAVEGNFLNAAFFIILGMIADGFDGKIARKINAVSDMGTEFDSLADLTTFGVASAVLLYEYTLKTMEFGIFISILVLACSALRLARFNVQNDTRYFEGMPTPAFGFFTAAYVISGVQVDPFHMGWIFAIFSLLMVSSFKYPTFKTASLRFWFGVILISISVISLTLINPRILLAAFLVYGLGGPFLYRWMKK